MKPESLQVRVWTPPKKHSESGCLKQCNMFENASLNGPQNRLKIDEKTHLGTPGTAEAHCGAPGKALGVPPGTKTYTNQPKTHLGTRKPGKNDAVRKRSRNTRRWPKFSTAAVMPLGVVHKNSHCEVLLAGVSIGSLLLLGSLLSAADWASPIWI